MIWIDIKQKLPEEGKEVFFDGGENPPCYGRIKYFRKKPFVITLDSSGEESCDSVDDFIRWLDETPEEPPFKSRLESVEAEQQTKPRYKVIADYPGSYYTVGDILDTDDEGVSEFGQFPHLFKKLEWWEERSADEMPQYVKAKDWMKENKWTVIHVDGIAVKHHFVKGEYFGLHWATGGGLISTAFEPATEIEYQEYKKLRT